MEPEIRDDSLASPIGPHVARLEPAQLEDSLRAVARDMAEQGVPAMPVASGHTLAGLVTESAIATALDEGVPPHAAVQSLMDTSPPTLNPLASRAEALQVFRRDGCPAIVVVDENRAVVGLLTPSRLIEHSHDRSFHGRVGGMATPFGVYLTNGAVSGGVGHWALVTTGMVMFAVFALAGILVLAVANQMPVALQRAPWMATGVQFAWLGLFMVGLRLLPLSGTHAAEHMVVHAIERGEELEPAIVRRMPRVHPRCGTNLAVGAMLFLGVMSWDAIKEQEVRLLLALIVTLAVWQPLGSLLQRFVTTKPPSDHQVAMGIQAGRDLLSKASVASVVRPGVLARIALSGLFQVLVGAVLVELLLWGAYEVLRVPPAWRVT